MWKKLLAKFGFEPKPAFCVETKAEVEAILKLDFSTESARKEHGKRVLAVLNRMLAEITTVEKRANGYPHNSIKADVWFAGVDYSNLACALTEHFKKAGWLKREENASALWAKAVLSTCAHYHHMVGPAMIANADCNDRLGNMERSTDLYESVVSDFVDLLEDEPDGTRELSDDEATALKALETATERLLKRGKHKVKDIDLSSVQSRVKKVLGRQTDG